MNVIIDNHAGPCPGVKKALRKVKEELETHSSLISLGPVIHNTRELERLEKLGLVLSEQEQVENGYLPDDYKDHTVFIRSHGISPQLELFLKNEQVNLLDSTCGIVKRVHNLVQSYFKRGFQIVITGKPGHPEVNGILGYCNNHGIVVQSKQDFSEINTNKMTLLVSQTTFDQEKFFEIQQALSLLIKSLIIKDTTCKHIRRRYGRLSEFAKSVDVVLMVGGKNSSNTGVLFDICKKNNNNSYRIEGPQDLDAGWFKINDTIGVTGSASTPEWQLEEVANDLEKLPEKGFNT